MSCLIDKIKDEIVGDSIGYTVKNNEIIVPNNSKNSGQSFTIAEGIASRVNSLFKADKFGEVVTVQEYNNSTGIKIHPSLALEQAYETRAEQKLKPNIVYGSRQKQKKEAPIGDNFSDIVSWKISQMEKYDNQLKKVTQNIVTQDTSENRKKKKQIEQLMTKTQNQIESLRENKTELLYHAIETDIKNIRESLKSDSLHDIDAVRSSIQFYKEFTNTLVQGDAAARHIRGIISEVVDNEGKLIENKVVKMMEKYDLVVDLLKNLNKDEKLKLSFDKDITAGEKINVRDLLIAHSDLSKADTQFFGTLFSNTGDTVLPQLLLSEFMRTVNQKQNSIISKVDKLKEFNNLNPNINKDVLIEKESNGDFLVDLYSKDWFKQLSFRKKFIDSFYQAKSATEKAAAYKNIWNWHKTNSKVINFFQLSEIKELHGNKPDYAKYFTYTDAEMAKYEKETRELLGPRYEETISLIKNKLQKFEEMKKDKEEKKNEPYFDRNIAQNNQWEFLNNYINGNSNPINYTANGNEGKVYFSAFSDTSYIAKDTVVKNVGVDGKTNKIVTEDVDTNFYSKDFKEVIKDPKLLELWGIYKDMAKYIDVTYEIENFGRINLPKVKTTFAENILKNYEGLKKGQFSKLGAMAQDSLHEYKSLFYEQGVYQGKKTDEINSNFTDASKKEIANLIPTYLFQGMSYKEATDKARKSILDTYSKDIDRNFIASLMNAALHDARQETAPLARMVLQTYKDVKDSDGNDRIKGIKKLQYYVDKVILNSPNAERKNTSVEGREWKDKTALNKLLKVVEDTKLGKKVGITEQDTKLFSEQEKIILAEYKNIKEVGYSGEFQINDEGFNFLRTANDDGTYSHYVLPEGGKDPVLVTEEVFDIEYNAYIENKIDSLGVSRNLAGLIDGILKTDIIKGLALAPVSGIFNRVEGIHTLMIMDLTGEYWSVGNNDKAKEFMSFANMFNISDKFVVGKKSKDRKVQLDIFKEVVGRLGDFQDRKDELQKATQSKNVESKAVSFLYKWAVTNPEFKNQGQVMLNIMQDETIEDNEGVEHPFFDGENFSAFELENGVLKLKDNFSKFSFESEKMEKLMLKASSAISHTNGNYNQYDIMLAKRTSWGRAVTLFKTWFPAHIAQRFGIPNEDKGEVITDLAGGVKKRQGRFIEGMQGSKSSAFLYGASVLGISFGIAGAVGLVGGGLVSAYVYKKFIKDIAGPSKVRQDISTILNLTEFIKASVLETLNYPSRVLSSVPGAKKLRINTETNKNDFFNLYKNTPGLTKEEAASLRAMARELGVLLTTLSIKLAAGALMFSDDDDEDSPQRRRHNFVQNQLSRVITTQANYISPSALIEDGSRTSLLKSLKTISEIVVLAGFEGEYVEAGKHAVGLGPFPRSVINVDKDGVNFLPAPWEDKTNYDQMKFKGLGELAWTQDFIKDFESDGEYSEDKEISEERAEFRDKIEKEYMSISKGNKLVLKAIKDNYTLEKFGKKNTKKGQTYIKKYDERELRDNLARNLNKLRLTEREKRAIIKKRF